MHDLCLETCVLLLPELELQIDYLLLPQILGHRA